MRNHTAISNPYNMEKVPRHLTPIDIQVNGRRGRCHRCGEVRVKLVSSYFLGKIPTDRYDENGDKVFEPVSLKLCSRCNSVLQSPAPVEAKKRAEPQEQINPKVLSLLALLVRGERSGKVLGEALEVSQATIWVYLGELVRMDCIRIKKEGQYNSLRLTEVTAEGLRRAGMEQQA